MKLAEQQVELKPVLLRLAESRETSPIDEEARTHLRNIEVHIVRMSRRAGARPRRFRAGNPQRDPPAGAHLGYTRNKEIAPELTRHAVMGVL